MGLHRFRWLTGLIATACSVQGQARYIPASSIYLSNSCGQLQPELFSTVQNPAGLAHSRRFRVAVSSEDPWGEQGLAFSRLAAAVPVSGGGLGLSLDHGGDKNYQESALGLGYGMLVGRASLGISVRLNQAVALGYAPVSSGSAQAGLRWQPVPGLLTGFSFTVPFPLSGSENPDRPAGAYRMELGFRASSQVSLEAAWTSDEALGTGLELLIDYGFADHFFAAAGLRSREAAPFALAGWKKNGIRIEIFTGFQMPLGFTPGLCLRWEKAEPEKPPR